MKNKRSVVSMTNKFQAGQKVRVIGDTFKNDPHGLPIGKIVEVHSISPATPFSEFDPLMRLVFAMNGIEPFDLPERVHVKLSDDDMDFTNIVFEDVEVAEVTVPKKIRMLEDCVCDGFTAGDVLDVEVLSDGELVFIDLDGDERSLEAYDHEIVE
jgi:hypothetical protein